MGIVKGMLAAVVCVGVAGGFASPAWAETPFNGKYTATVDYGPEDSLTGTWTVKSTCQTEGCVAHVTSSSAWTADATLSDGQWTMQVRSPDGYRCDGDDQNYAETQTWTWDAESLAGQVSGVAEGNPPCPEGPPDRFSLTKIN
jgi:hypothetical protein